MKQQCYLSSIYLTWGLYLVGLIFLVATGRFSLAIIWFLGAPLAQWIYVKSFPRVSHLAGYGRVGDEQANRVMRAPVKVTLYTAVGCPFCPLMEQRLDALRKEMGFELDKIDVTLKPDRLTNKGIRAVPVVEVGQQRLIGHATSKQLAELILGQLGLA